MSTPSDLAAAVQALAAATLAATTSPADALRVLGELADFTPNDPKSSAPAGIAQATMQSAIGDLCRRAAVVAIARASATYQPSSYDDAAKVRETVCALLDDEALIAADQGEDGSYAALRSLRAAVSADLTQRGASLSPITTIASPVPTSALALAYRQYQDAGRSDELVAQVTVPHPAFMPASFKALAQ